MLLCLEFTITPSSIIFFLQHVQSIFHTQETTVDTLKNSSCWAVDKQVGVDFQQ